jgi:hypothetical protein
VLDVNPKGGSAYGLKFIAPFWSKFKNSLEHPLNSINVEIISNIKTSKNVNQLLPRIKDVTYMNCMEFSLKANDYRDALSIAVDGRYGYSKIYDIIRIPINVNNNDIDLEGESHQSLASLNVNGTQVLFLIRCQEGSS